MDAAPTFVDAADYHPAGPMARGTNGSEGGSMLNLMQKLVRDEDGLEMVEWAIVAALVTSAGAATMVSIGSQVNNQFSLILTAIQAGG